MARSTLTEGLPPPLSICARYRSEVCEACANCRRVMPRLARLRRTSLPIAARKAAAEEPMLDNVGFSAEFGVELATNHSP
jgi:hypothetical protein